MITYFETAFNVVTAEPLEGDFVVSNNYLYTYPINMRILDRGRFSLSSPNKIKYR